MKILVAGLAALVLGLAPPAAQAAPPVGAHLPINLTPASQVTLRPAAGGYTVVDVRPAMGAPEIAPASRTATGESMSPIPRRLSFTAPPGTVR